MVRNYLCPNAVKRIIGISLVLVLLCSVMSGCSTKSKYETDYSEASNWAYYENEETDTKADVFFICPTVYYGDDDSFNMSLADEDTKSSFLGAVNMEKGIYDEESRFFARITGKSDLTSMSLTRTSRQTILTSLMRM